MTREETIKYLQKEVITSAGKAEECLWKALDARSLAWEKKWLEWAATHEAWAKEAQTRLRSIRGW
jgi:hypothetical protein